MQVMIALYGGNKSLSELREITGSTSQALIPKIRRLESKLYIVRDAQGYALSPAGRILGSKICGIVDVLAAIEHNREFWSTHYMEAIPFRFLEEIGSLHAAELITNVDGDVFRVFQNYQSVIRCAECIFGVTSIMSTFHADLLASRIVEGVRVELIVNPQLAADLSKDPYIAKLRTLGDYPHFRIHMVPDSLNLGMTVTDTWLSLGLNLRSTMRYDHTSDLVCNTPEAVAWGLRLFEHYLPRATEVDFFRR
jgi:predicted transcriptional regulator